MTKGELFDVLDNSGKWWQVARIDGSGEVGISPSNCAFPPSPTSLLSPAANPLRDDRSLADLQLV